MAKPVPVLLIVFLIAAVCMGADQTGCPLSFFSNGQVVTLHGRIGSSAHDMLLMVPHCDETVILVYAGDSETKVPATKLTADRNLKRFRRYTEATYEGAGKAICMGSPEVRRRGDPDRTLRSSNNT